jgi:hypothetical protein
MPTMNKISITTKTHPAQPAMPAEVYGYTTTVDGFEVSWAERPCPGSIHIFTKEFMKTPATSADIRRAGGILIAIADSLEEKESGTRGK